MLFSRAKWTEEGEKPTGYFLKLQSRGRDDSTIRKLIDDDGNEITGNAAILQACTRHFTKLYATTRDSASAAKLEQFFADLHIPKLTNGERDSCEGPISNDECLAALKSMANDKAPGPSGFTKEFIITFWDVLGSLIVSYANSAYERGEFFITQRRGYIALLPKKGDQRMLSNKRPIVLLDILYKIVAKVLARRLSNVIDKLIATEQTGFLRGRNISDNLRLTSDVMFYCKEKELPGILMNLDYAAAFDSVEHDFLFRALEAFNFGPSFVRWIRILYEKSELAILNNGLSSEWIHPSRAVRQGCPISGLLFVLAVETFADKLRNCNEVAGILINRMEIKISQYADDTTIFVRDEQSARRALCLLDAFGQVSGLRLNMSKTDFVWLGCNRMSQEPICGKACTNQFKSLGVIFSPIENCFENNIYPKIRKMRSTMNMWKERDLSLKGRITLVKMLMASQYTYLASAYCISKEVCRDIDRELSAFLWRNRPPKVKRSVLCQPIAQGGLNAMDFTSHISALRLTWCRRMLRSTYSPWRVLLQNAVGKLRLEDLLCTDFDVKKLAALGIPPFYISALKEYEAVQTKDVCNTPQAVYNQRLWHNKHIKIDGKSIFLAELYQREIKCVGDLAVQGALMSHSQLEVKYPGTQISLYKYQSLVHAIPREWKAIMKQDASSNLLPDNRTTDPEIRMADESIVQLKSASCRILYQALLPKATKPRSQTKWAEENFRFSTDKWSQIQMLPYKSCSSTKLQTLQYRIINRFIPTRKFLYTRKIIDSPLCDACAQQDSINHFLVDCAGVQRLWHSIARMLRRVSSNRFRVCAEHIIFGCVDAPRLVNYVILLGKEFIIAKKLRGDGELSIVEFKARLKKQYHVDRLIATKKDRLVEFHHEWDDMMIT